MNTLASEIRLSFYFGIVLLVVITWGFYKTYLIHFPGFDNFVFIQHFHGVVMLLWMGCLIVQPLLIKSKDYHIHRMIGKLSYALAPILVLSIFLVSRMSYARVIDAGSKASDAMANLALSLPLAFAFIVLYVLAIFQRKVPADHMRYMIGTGILMLGPGLGRGLLFYSNMSFETGVLVTNLVIVLLASIMLINDLLRRKPFAASLVVTLVVTITMLLWEFRMEGLWQYSAGIVVTTWEIIEGVIL